MLNIKYLVFFFGNSDWFSGLYMRLKSINNLHLQIMLVWIKFRCSLKSVFNNIPLLHGSLVYICGL